MSFEKKTFEQEGFKIEGDRVLTYSKLSCPLDCTYCFVEDMNFNQEKNAAYLSEKQFELIHQLPEEVKIIMLGCDTEFFQHKDEALQTLEKLSGLNRDVSVVTKLPVSEQYIKKLQSIAESLDKKDNLFSFSISLPCTKSSPIWEPKVPSPEKRIETLKNVYNSNIKTLVALRPLLPTVTGDELEDIVSRTKDYQYGYYSGPLYLKDLNHPSIQDISDLEIEKVQPPWMPEGNIFYKIEKKGQMEMLSDIIQRCDRQLYDGAADAIKHLKEI